MTRLVANELRHRVVPAVVDGGLMRRGAAKHFGIAPSTAIKSFYERNVPCGREATGYAARSFSAGFLPAAPVSGRGRGGAMSPVSNAG